MIVDDTRDAAERLRALGLLKAIGVTSTVPAPPGGREHYALGRGPLARDDGLRPPRPPKGGLGGAAPPV
jgi:hypothetical protein